jgi:hypothetical protein
MPFRRFDLFNSYCDEIHKERDLFALWEPIANPVQLGDYGTMEAGNRFNPIGNIRDFGIPIEARDSPSGPIKYESQSKLTYHVPLKVGDVAPAKLDVKFTKKNSILMIVEELTISEIKNLTEVDRKLCDYSKSKNNRWRMSWKFVTQRYISRRFFIAISEDKDTQVTFTGKIPAAVTGAASISLKDMSYSTKRGAVATYDHNVGTVKTPLFQLFEIKDSAFSPRRIEQFK